MMIKVTDKQFQAFPFLCELNSNVIRFGLDSVRRLLERIDNPHLAYPSVLIGGTNGKGSISAILSSILQAAGFKVGLYTSPHLIDVRERIRINGVMISPERMGDCINIIRRNLREPVTYFEFLTALACLHFSREQVEIAVLEVGMGGRLDATNVVTPLASVISNVCKDHQEYLGRRLKDIAHEKAGIIKENGICITAAGQKTVLDVLSETCRKQGATLYRLGKELRVRTRSDGPFFYQGIERRIENLSCPLAGGHQIRNAALALAAAEVVSSKGLQVGDQALRDGLAGTTWEGRMEVLQNRPTVLVDGAHNPAGVAALCKALRSRKLDKRRLLVFGVLNDKNYPQMLKKLLPLFDSVIFTRPKTERSLELASLIRVAQRYGRSAEAIEDSGMAVGRALQLAEKEDLICAAGSLYLVGEIKKMYAEAFHFAGNNGVPALTC